MKSSLFALLALGAALWGQNKVYPERWVYVSGELGTDQALEKFRDIARTASEHGLTAIMFSSGFDRLDLQRPENVARLKEAKAICDRYHLELIPSMFGTGYGGGILSHDKNLAEGLLAKDALFVVEGGEARFSPEPSASLVNGGFEEHHGAQPDGFLPGEKAAVDTAVFHSGKASLRLEGFGGKPDDSAHIVQQITVKPYRQYRLSMWVKTEDVKPGLLGGIHALSDDGRSLHPWEPRISGTSDWHQLVSGFNSSSATKFRLDIGVFEAARGATGKVWIDDVAVEEVGLLNVLRRDGTPVTVRDEKTGAVYEEGKDYAPIADPELNFRWNHAVPSIRILPGGRIPNGARLRVSYYHGTTIYQDQVPVCISEPKSQAIWDKQVQLLHDLLAPHKYMMAMDELRMANSCETCRRRGLTAAELVGAATTRQFNAIRAIDPKAEVYVWSDMYDPNHNARNHYYLVEGDLTGTWNYIPKDLRIVTWYYERRALSLAFFSKLGFQTLAGAYYDANNLDNPKGWLQSLDQTPGAIGIMYTTWQNKYSLLPDFGDLVSRGAGSGQPSRDAASSVPPHGAWKVLGPGGGGAQFNPTVSPADPNLVLVNCDMTGTYISTDGGSTWRMFNLRGVARFIVPDPVNSSILYVATGGLYRSRDKGRTWELIYPRPDDVSRVLISGDHGDEQIQTRDGARSAVQALAVDPADSNTLFAAISKDQKTALYRSTDAAKTWEPIADLPSGGRHIYIDPASPKTNRTLYIVGTDSIAVLENGALRRQPAPAGVNRLLDVAAGFPGAGKKPILYAVSGIDWRGGNTGATGLWVSLDGGAAWTTIPIDFLSPAPKETARVELRAVGASLNHPETAYLSFRDHTRSLAADQRAMGVAKTSDAGKTWQLAWRDTDASAAPNVQDAWITQRYGPGWGENPFGLGVSPTNPDVAFGTDFGRTMRTRDGGKTWQGVYARRLDDGGTMTTGLDVLTTNGIHFDPFDPSHWLVSFADLGLFEARNRGQSWTEATSRGIPREWQNTSYWAVFDPEVKGRIWAAVSGVHDLPRPKMWRSRGVAGYRGGIVVSDDGGKSWKPSVEGMEQTAATHILLDSKSPAGARTLYVCSFGRGVYKSTDGGRHWSLKNAGIEGAEPFAWRIVPDSAGRLYLLVARRSEDGSIGTPQDGALYRSSDGAEHWEKLSLPAGSNAPNGLAVDPADPARLYLAAWGRRGASGASGDSGGGIFLSTDAGKTWKNVLDKDQHVFDVTPDPRAPGVLYATGFESSVWKSSNRGETWNRLQGYNFKWGQRVIPDPADAKMIYVCTFGGCIWHGPADGDPSAAEDIATLAVRPAR